MDTPPDRARSTFGAFRAWLPALVPAAVGIYMMLTLRGGYWHESHEWIWYPVRLVEYVQAWKAGAFYPRWCPDLYGGYGYPFFNYYAPAVYATAALFMVALSSTPALALKLTACLFTIAGAGATFGLIRSETRRSDAALLGATVFVLLPYRCNDLFVRGDLAEYAAFALVPAVLWGYRQFLLDETPRPARVGTLTALAHAAVLFCHTLTGLYTTELVALLLLLTLYRQRRKPRRVLHGFVVLGLAIGISAVYSLPALAERNLVHLDNINGGAFHPSANMVYWRWTTGAGFFSPGAPFFIGFFVAVCSLVLPSVRRRSLELAGWWLPCLVFLNLMMTWSAPVWDHLPFGSFIQFPWRLLGFVGVFGSVGIGVTFALVCPPRWWVAWPACLLFAGGVVYAERPYLVVKFIAEDKIPATPKAIAAGIFTSVVANEYQPRSVVIAPTKPRAETALVVEGEGNLRVRESTGLRYLLDVDVATPATVDVQTFYFPGWKLRTERGPRGATLETAEQFGTMRIRLPSAGSYRLVVWFGSTWLRGLAALATWLSLLGCYPLVRRLTRKE